LFETIKYKDSCDRVHILFHLNVSMQLGLWFSCYLIIKHTGIPVSPLFKIHCTITILLCICN